MLSYLKALLMDTDKKTKGQFVRINNVDYKYDGELVCDTPLSTLTIKGPFNNCDYVYKTKLVDTECSGDADLNEQQFIFSGFDFSCESK